MGYNTWTIAVVLSILLLTGGIGHATAQDPYYHFEVSILDTNEPVEEGEDVVFEVEVHNTGHDPGTQNVTLIDFNGLERDSVELSLNESERATLNLTWETELGDNGSGDIEVRSEDDVSSRDYVVLQEHLWRTELPNAGTSSPTVVGETVFSVEAGAYDVSDGGAEWELSHRASSEAPAVADGTMYVGDRDGIFKALDADTGSVEWEFETEGSWFSSPLVKNDTVYFGAADDADNGLYALHAENGTEKWASLLGSSGNPVYENGSIYTSSGSEILAFDAYNGSMLWRFETGGTSVGGVTVANGTVFGGIDHNLFYAVDAEEGVEEWRFSADDRIFTESTVHGDSVYFSSYDNHVYALDVESGNERWSFETGDWVGSSPTVAEDTVYVGSDDNHLYALDRSSGAKKWEFEMTHNVGSSPTVVEDVLYIENGGILYAIDEGVEGTSEDTRVNLGTLGHHDAWAKRASSPMEFEVSIIDSNEPVAEGENVTVNVEVVNAGEFEETQNISLEGFDGSTVDASDVTIEPGDSTNLSLVWDTVRGDNGLDEVKVLSETDVAEENIGIAGNLDDCRDINAPGLYWITEDLVPAEGSPGCVNVNVSDVEIHGHGHLISGHGDGFGFNVAGGSEGVHIKDVGLSSFESGVRLHSNNSYIRDVDASDSTTGVEITEASNNTVWDVPGGVEVFGGKNEVFGVPVGAGADASSNANASVKDVALEAKHSPPSTPEDEEGIAFWKAENKTSDGYLNISVEYEQDDVDGLEEDNLSVKRHDEESGEWGEELDSGLMESENEIEVDISEFSTFGVIAPVEQGDDDDDAEDDGSDEDSDDEVDDDIGTSPGGGGFSGSGTRTISEPEFSISSVDYKEREIFEEESVEFSGVVELEEGFSSEDEVGFFVEGGQVDSRTVELMRGESEQLQFEYVFGEAGYYEVEIRDEKVGEITVLEEDDDSIEGEEGEPGDGIENEETEDGDPVDEGGTEEGLPGFTAPLALIALIIVGARARTPAKE